MSTTISVPPQHDRHEWVATFLCARSHPSHSFAGQTCMCGAERWVENGVEHMTPGWISHPIPQSLENPKWQAFVAVGFGRACPTAWPEEAAR